MPGLDELDSATRRLTGSVCSAIQTVPMPPSPICSSSLYGPMTVPGLRAARLARRHPERPGGRRFGRGLLQEAARAFVEPQQVLHLLAQLRLPGAGLVQVGAALGRVFLLQGGDEDVALGHGSTCFHEAAILQCGIRARIAQTFLEKSCVAYARASAAAQGAEQPGAA